MKQKIEILSYLISASDIEINKIRDFFSGKYWIQVKNNQNLYRRKYGSIFYEIKKENDVRISTWTEGGFGVILPYKHRILGIFDKSGVWGIQEEFENYLKVNNINFDKTIEVKEGLSQSILLLIMFIFAIFGAVIINLIF